MYWLLLFFSFFHAATAARIGRFTFLSRELLQEGETMRTKANDLETIQKNDRSFLGKVAYENGQRVGVSTTSQSLSRLQNLLNHFPTVNNSVGNALNTTFYVQMRFKQKERETFTNETSDYFALSSFFNGGENALQNHVTVEDCVDNGPIEAFQFHISPYAYNYSAQYGDPNVLESECTNHSFKTVRKWHHDNSVVATTKSIENECFDNNVIGQEHYRYLEANFVEHTFEPETVLTSEVLCTNSAVEHVTFAPSNTTETFVEEFVLEEECRDNADALTPMLSFNANMRWKKSNREDAENVSEVLPLQTTNASVPFYKYQTYSSTGILLSNVNEETHLFANDEAPFSVPTGITSTWYSSEPAFTLTAWVKGHGTVMSIHTFSEVCGKQAIFAIDQSGQPTLNFNCNEDSHASTLLTNTKEWTHVAFGYDGFGTRTIVVDGVEATDVYHNTTFDYVLNEGTELSNAHVHNEVLVLQNELGDVVGSFAGYSIKDCLNATMSMNHAFFTVENGVCKSSASVVDSVGQSTFHRTVQYRITREDFKELTVGPFQGYVDELLLYAQPLTKETVVEIGRSQNIGHRFDGSSLVHALRKGEGVSRKVSWEQYPNFFEEDLPRSACVSEGDHRYEQFVENHSTFLYTAEGRGNAYAVLYEPYAGGAENVSFLASATFNCQSDLNLDHKLLIHSYQNNTTLANCRLQETENGLCRNEEGELSMEAKTSCTGTFLPLTNFTWLPDPYEIEYDTLESDCPQTSEIWGTSEALLVGLHGRNTHVYNDHERTFYFKNKYGGDRHYLNTTSLLSVKEWCRGTVSCAGIQQDGNKYFPVENIAAPEHETDDYSGFRVCLYDEAPRIRSAMDCYASAVRALAPSYWPYVHGDELRSHAWGYVGVSTGEVCSRDSNGTFYWDTTMHGDLLCSDKPNDYYTVPIVQTRWQRDNDTVSSKKEADCVDRRLDWLAHSYEYETHGTASRPHFQIQGQKSWQEEPVECLYTTNATFQINVTTLRQCRDEAIFFSASGYSFQREGSEFMYMTARHFAHVEDARDECKRLHAHVAGPEDSWDLCSNQEYDCSIDNTCINADTPDNTIFAVAACCMNTGTSCAITSDTSVCTPKHGYESFSFQFCTDERIENASNTTYNVYAPQWNRSEWRAETHSRTYDESYYDIVALYETDSPCSRGLHLSYDECVALRATVGNHSWLGTVYDREKIAGCAFDSDGNLYWNRYTYDSAKRVESTDQQFCRLPYELFSSTFHYTNTSCMYLNHELEVTVSSVVECSTYAKDHLYKAISYANSICLLAKERGPCEENHAWTSFFYVEPSDVETFLLNENLEHSVESFTDCVLNTTAMPVFKQVPYGTEEHGVLYDTSRAAAYGTLDAAKDACDANDNCTIVYTSSNSIYYALTEDTGTEELIPVDPQYALVKHWKKNTVNYHNRTHLRHFFANNKELCLDACNNDRYCAQIMFSNTYCFLFGQVMEETASHALLNSVVMFNERKGAVAYHEENGECWLYKNDIGKSYFGPDGDCRNFQPADHFNVYPLDASLRTENKVVYLIEDADTSLSTTPNVMTEERSKEWCNNREGASSWQAYGTVLSVTKENECIGTWNRHPNLVRINTLQRECEQMDTNAVSFARNADHVTSTTDGSLVYQKQYLNGYKKQFHKACGSDGERIDYQVETSVLYGESCHEEVETADCQSRDIGYGYAVQGSKCLVYQHIVGSNHSDCRYRHTVHNTTTYHPVSYHNFVEAVDACNQFNACVGVCEAGDGTRSFYPSKVLPTEATAQCHHGWSGEDCSIQEATTFTHERITNKRFTAIDFCEQMGQELCEESFVPIVHSCVHYKEATNCSEYDFSSEPVAYCCGKQSNAGVFRQEAVFYQRVENLHTCQDPAIEKLGSAVHDHTPKLIDSYTVEHVATGLCKGSTLMNTSECESTCLHASTCSYFSNSTNGSCWMHSTCQNGFAYHKGDYNTYRIRQKAGVFDTPQDAYADLIGDCKYHYAVEEQPIVEAVPFHESTDSLRDRWHCERAFIDHKRNFMWSIHSFNESFQFDIMEAHYIEDSRRMYEALQPLNVSVSSASTLDECLESASNQYVVSFNETSLTCMHYYDPWEALKGTYTLLGSSRKSSGYYEGPFQMTLDFFESTHLTTYNPHVTVNDWTLSTAKDDCEVLCEQHADCKAFILDQQNCHLHRLPNQTTIDYMRSVQGTGHVLVYVRTTAEFLCRHNGAAWDLKETIVETTTMHPLVNTEALPEAVSLAMCKHAFLNDARVPRLDTLLYDESTGECRISLLRNQLVRTSNVTEPNNFTHYVLSETYQNPFRTTATLLETEDIARDTCFTYHQLLTGRDASSWAAAPFWERERDVIRHEILEEDCGVTLPPQLPKLAYAWEKNQQGSLTFNVKEETCKASDLFLSWRTNVAGKRRIVVNNESECMEYSSNETSATYLGNELIEQADYRSSCNGIVDENNFERIFADQPIRMLASEDNRIAVREASIDACAATAANYYAHFNRSTETKVFEYHFTKEGDNCAYFMSEECAGLCFPETNPSANRVGFSSFRLDSTLGMTAASCWILSVMDSTEGNQYCRKCPIGKFNSRAASNCLPCQQGRYADETGLKACKSCPEGTFSFGSGSTHCHHCPKGTYQDEMGERQCKICAAGQYEQNGACVNCPVGKAAPNNFPENKAGDLQYTGTSYRGGLMYYDPRFDYSGVHGVSNKNEEGVYMHGYSPIFTSLRNAQAKAHDSEDDCVVCEAGTYSDQAGASICKACQSGLYQDQTEQTSCKSCNIGEVARTGSKAGFHYFMPQQCSSAELLGEIRDSMQQKTMEDVGLINEVSTPHVEACFDTCQQTTSCLFVSYKDTRCQLFRKCDEIGESGWASYRLSSSFASLEDSSSLEVSTEIQLYGPSHHECMEVNMVPTPETYILRENRKITEEGTIGTALTYDSAISQCNAMVHCIGFTYGGSVDASTRTFSENDPILLKSQGDHVSSIGFQAWFKEEPVETKLDCQQQCAQNTHCNFMEWNTTKVCRKWQSCTLRKKEDLTAAESNLYSIGRARSFALFAFQGRWPCDADVHVNQSRSECEEEANGKGVPMFYHEEDTGACHVYVSYTSEGIKDLYTEEIKRSSKVCKSGSVMPNFDSAATGSLYLLGSTQWDVGATTCSFCPAGLHTEISDAVVCRQCRSGTYDKFPDTSSPCQACEIGRFQDESGQSTCKACSAGRFQDTTGGTSCKASGQGYKTIGQGFPLATQTELRTKSSGPLQNNTFEDAVDLNIEGATGREICGRNSFAAGYENMRCVNTPVGAISVIRARTWVKESARCIYTEAEATTSANVSATLSSYDNELYNRMGISNLDECIDFANEHSNGDYGFATAVSFGQGQCMLFSNTDQGVPPNCISNEQYESASLTVGANEYASTSEDPPVPNEWFRTYTPHDSVRFVSPYECQGIHYEYIGDFYSASDCIQICRMQEAFGEKKCRYISYSNADNKCYMVNWMPSTNGAFQQGGKIFEEDGTANIELPCSYGSRLVPVGNDEGIGSGGYKVEVYVPNAAIGHNKSSLVTDVKIGNIMAIKGRLDKFGLPSRGNGGTSTSFSFPDVTGFPTVATFFYSNEEYDQSLALWWPIPFDDRNHFEPHKFVRFQNPDYPSDYFRHTINFDYYRRIEQIQVKGGFLVELGEDANEVNGEKIYSAQIHYIVPETIQCNGQTFTNLGFDISQVTASQTSTPAFAIITPRTLTFDPPLFAKTLKCTFTDIQILTRGSDGTDGQGIYCDTSSISFGTTSDPPFYSIHCRSSSAKMIITAAQNLVQKFFKVDRTQPDIKYGDSNYYDRISAAPTQEMELKVVGLSNDQVPDSEWDIEECDSTDKMTRKCQSPDYSECFEADCRHTRRRYYDRLKAALLQQHTIPANSFPDYKINGGYQGDNKLSVLGFYDIWDLNDVPPTDVSSEFHTLQSSSNEAAGLWFAYKRKNHIKFDHESIRPLFDVSLNTDNFETSETESERAIKGANAFTYCTGSTTMLKEMNTPLSCEDVGYPFVINPERSSGGAIVCTKLEEADAVYTQSNTHCCIGQACSGYDTCKSAGAALESIDYAASELKITGDILLEHTDDDPDIGFAYVKDRCNQLGEICLAVTQDVSNEFYYAHGQDTTLSFTEGTTAYLKYANYIEEGRFGLMNGKPYTDSTVHDCYLECLRTKFCQYFHFTLNKECLVQSELSYSFDMNLINAVTFKIMDGKDDNTKSQFCSSCSIGRTASTTTLGGVGMCTKCEPGSISSDDSLFVSNEHIGQSGQESCQACPEGMLFLKATQSCIACPRGFICTKTGSMLENGAEQCPSNQYSTSSLLEFLGDDVSTEASLRCEACSSGKYAVEQGAQRCERCPKGFFSKNGLCQPCAVGEYTLFSGSEECYQVDKNSFIAWPASTLSDKELCSTDDCIGNTETLTVSHRTCTSNGDAVCQQCPTLRAGHRTFSEDGECKVLPCGRGKYSPSGCYGEDCCEECVSSCVAGQHSVGCGHPDDPEDVAHTKNTECESCPVNTFTQFDALSSCENAHFGNLHGNVGTCQKGIGSPHKAGTFTSANPFRWLGKTSNIIWPTVQDNRYPSAADIQTSLAEQQCCSAAAYECVPCRTTPTVSYSSNFAIGGVRTYFGRSNQPPWSTNGLTGQASCRSYWDVWAYQSYKDMKAYDEKHGKPKDDGT